MPTRRRFLHLGAGTVAVAALSVPGRAPAAGPSYDVSYLWSRTLDRVLDYREVVAEPLGPEVARDLVIVRARSGNWGVVLDLDGADQRTATAIAASHHKKLRAVLGGDEVLATAVSEGIFARTHHVRYGGTCTAAEAAARFDVVADVLGPTVRAKLVAEALSDEASQVVYKVFADAHAADALAAEHGKKLAAHAIVASVVDDRYLDERQNAASAKVAAAPSVRPQAVPAARPPNPAPTPTAAAPTPKPRPPILSGPASPPPGDPPDLAAVIAAVAVPMARPEPPAPKVAAVAPPKVAVAAEPEVEPRVEPKVEPRVEPKPAAKAEPAPKVEVAAGADDLPAVVGADLPAVIATPLRDAINAHIQALRKAGQVDGDETTSWYVHTLHDDRTWAAINADRPLQCASMVKPYLALAFFHRVQEGRLVYGKVSRGKLEAMIQRSDNAAANWVFDTLGGPDGVQRILASNYGKVLRETTIEEVIPADGRTYRNRSSARDYVRFCRALWRKELAGADEIQRLMALPGRDRLITGAELIPATTRVMNKTGTTAELVGDFGILVAEAAGGHELPYALVGIVEKESRARNYGAWVTSRAEVIRSVSSLTYRELEAHYNKA